MKRAYQSRDFKPESLEKIQTANTIVAEYLRLGLRLTLRQLYYQFVAHHDLPNTERSYQNLGTLISGARLAGLLDWDAIEDRGRVADVPRQWRNIQSLVDVAIEQFRLPRWAEQDNYVELWVEKQALAGVLEPVAEDHHITLMVNKGYSSQSAMHESAQRFLRNARGHDACHLLYLGDHDPSGEDMVRDIHERLEMFGADVTVTKVALTMEQIEEHEPPPNPAKLSDSRAAKYVALHGAQSWEVDALDPETLVDIIKGHLDDLLDRDLMQEVIDREDEQRDALKKQLAKLRFE